jgi:hypothetical protein
MGGSVTKISLVQPGKYYNITNKICGDGNGSVCNGNTYPSTFYATISSVETNGGVIDVSVFTGGGGYKVGDLFYLIDNKRRTRAEEYCIVVVTEVSN